MLLLIPTIKAIKKTVKYCTTEFVITNKKLVEKYGWLNTHCDEMVLSSIENITVTQSLWGKIFKYGNVIIQGTNRNNINYIGIRKPETVRVLINQSRG
ncbi:MAG: PH domain-containing protein [Bacilli bacterium]|nr:PH domain-containing protein [Bacilli bacterium]